MAGSEKEGGLKKRIVLQCDTHFATQHTLTAAHGAKFPALTGDTGDLVGFTVRKKEPRVLNPAAQTYTHAAT